MSQAPTPTRPWHQRAAAPALGLAAALGGGLTMYQAETLRTELRAQGDRMERRIDRLEERLWDRRAETPADSLFLAAVEKRIP